MEFARYVDEFESPWLKAYFDVGNVVFYGFPQDWIRALGPRIAKVHLKDFQLDRPNGRFAWTQHRRGRHRLARRPPGVRRRRLSRLLHDGSVRRRQRLPDRSRAPPRPVPRGAEAGVMPAEVTESTERTGKPQSNGATETRRDSAIRRVGLRRRPTARSDRIVKTNTDDRRARFHDSIRLRRRFVTPVESLTSVRTPLLRVSVVKPLSPSPPLTGGGCQRR